MAAPSPWMSLALAEAAAAGPVSPNPAVGCVIVAHGAPVGSGHTQPPGAAHAEVMALRAAGERARGAAVYVTLEPCSHHGRTPPCADALIRAGVAAVHCALPDPDGNVSGRGIERLRAAGIQVTVGDGEAAARAGLAAYLTHRLAGRPLVTAKFAASLDGKVATRTGDARWVSGEVARATTRRQRADFDALLVGVGTVLADDPLLTARLPDGSAAPRQPLRVVLDSRGRTPPDAALLGPDAPVLLLTTARAGAEWRAAVATRGAEVVSLGAGGGGQVDLGAALAALAGRGVLSLLVEGGATVHGAFFDAGLVDRVQAIIAPIVVGGVEAPGAVGGRGPALMRDALRPRAVAVQRLGDDLEVRGALTDDPWPPDEWPAALAMPAAGR